MSQIQPNAFENAHGLLSCSLEISAPRITLNTVKVLKLLLRVFGYRFLFGLVCLTAEIAALPPTKHPNNQNSVKFNYSVDETCLCIDEEGRSRNVIFKRPNITQMTLHSCVVIIPE